MSRPTPQHRNGEAALRRALRRLRRVVVGRTPTECRRPPSQPADERRPVSVEPTNTFEYHVIARLNALEEDIAAIKARHDWLIRLVLGGVLTAILDLILS